MCHVSVLEFLIEEGEEEEFKGKRVLEIGSKYVNGSVRPLIERFLCPKEYVGSDIESGRYVDVILGVESLAKYFGQESFDAVIATELLEHIDDWRVAITNIKEVLKPNGILYISTRSKGFLFHAYPYDFWRFEVDDIKIIFSDFDIISLRKDNEAPGVFLKCRKPHGWKPINLERISLYSMILGRRNNEVLSFADMPLSRKARLELLKRLDRLRDYVTLF